MPRPSIARRDAFALILAAAAWGLGTAVSKRALDELHPLTLLPIQLGASLLALGLLARRGPHAAAGTPTHLGALGILNPGLAYALGLLGLTSISASLSVLLWAVEPVMIVILAAWLLGERLTWRMAALSAVAVAGLALVVGIPAGGGSLAGVVLAIAGVVCCAVYSVVTRRWLPSAPSTIGVVVAQQAYALAFAVVLAGAVAIVGGLRGPGELSAVGLASAIGSGLLYYGAAYWLYLGALRRVPASVAAASFYLIPLFGLAAGRVLLGDELDPRQWLGAAITLAAVIGIVRDGSVGAVTGRAAARATPTTPTTRTAPGT